ncbi:Uma2 family endonuclease [Streptomyces morookaense]|uniref:Uma2 family endonuclease n=1 Tax=Streptomyces morookaense TaxID=1970 RepID=UPI0033E3EE2C
MSWGNDYLQLLADRAADDFRGVKVDVLGERLVITKRTDIHCWTIFRIVDATRAAGIPEERVLSKVLIHFPEESPREPDVTILSEGTGDEPYSHEAVLAAMEIVSTEDDESDYAIKVRQYARFQVPTFVVVDPFKGQSTVLSRPSGESYASQVVHAYGETISLQLADGRTVDIPTKDFKRRSTMRG